MNRDQMVIPFLEMSGMSVDKKPTDVLRKHRELALSLIFEEACEELAEASGVQDKLYYLCKEYTKQHELRTDDLVTDKIDVVEQLDALADAQYVVSWAINVLGHKEHFDKAYEEVCRSNNSKACKNMDEAQATVDFVMENTNEECTIFPVNDKFVVKRNSDGKLMKNKYYSPANFKQFLEPLQHRELNDNEEIEFRKWARDNYIKGQDINSLC